MLPLNFTAVVARNELWTGHFATEPYEGGWAREAIIFVRALAIEGRIKGTSAQVEISPDGLHWTREGTHFVLPGSAEEITFARVSHFGNWLRIAADLPAGVSLKAIVAIHLK